MLDTTRLRLEIKGLGEDYGLHLVQQTGLPLVIAVDGIERIDNDAGRSEVVGLIRLVEDMTKIAASKGNECFPICLLFTGITDRWERWISVFEGRVAADLRGEIRRFSDDEYLLAQERHEDAYDFILSDADRAKARGVLRLPAHMRYFATANRFGGRVDTPSDFSATEVMAQFLNSRVRAMQVDDPGVAQLVSEALLQSIAAFLVESSSAVRSRSAVTSFVASSLSTSSNVAESVLAALIRAGLLMINDSKVAIPSDLILTHLLSSRMAQLSVDTDRPVGDRKTTGPRAAPDEFEVMAENIARSDVVESSQVRVQAIDSARAQANGSAAVAERFITSSGYSAGRLSAIRAAIGAGKQIDQADLDAVFEAIPTLSAQEATSAFFILAARPTNQPAERVSVAFRSAWASCEPELHWRLVEKMHRRGLVGDLEVGHLVSTSRTPRTWESYYGCLLEAHSSPSPASPPPSDLGEWAVAGTLWRELQMR